MEILKAIWSWLDGKKRIIGIIVVFVAGGLRAIEVIDESAFDALVALGGTVAAVGVGHAIKKLL